MSLRLTIILLLVVMTKRIGSTTTNISAEIITFCTCWQAVILCEDQTVFLNINIDSCPKGFVWEQPAGSLTKFQVITSYNGTNVLSTILCERNKGIICKQPIVSFARDLMTFGFAVKIASVCFRFDFGNIDHCNCLPIRREITTCRPIEITTFRPLNLDHMTQEIILEICIPLFAVVCIVSLIIIVRKYVAVKRHNIEHRQNNDEVPMITLPNIITN